MHRFHRVRLLAALAAIATVAGCADGPTQPLGPRAALTTLPRPLTPAEQSIIEASNDFSFALFGKVSAAQPGANMFLSPLSASMSLGMALNGAGGSTYDEMRAALRFGSATQHDIDAGYHSLIALLTSLDPGVQLQVANSIWYDRTFPFAPAFLDTTSTYFDAEVQPLDFNDASGSLSAINGWVSARTHGKIPSILTSIASNDVMYLLNAVYFKGQWRQRFDSASTEQATFTPATGAPQTVPLMHANHAMRYTAAADYQAVELPYGDSAFAMIVLLPAPGTSVDALADSLSPGFWAGLTSSLQLADVDLYLPRLDLTYGRTLNGDLMALGMPSAFDPDAADFSRMSAAGGLYISFVKQNTFVHVDESGTEAAAATATGVGVTSVQEPPPAVMRVDRPYLFVIRERLSGTLLFMGKIARVPTG